MRPSGAFELTIWRARLKLGKSKLLRQAVSRARALLPDSRDRHLRAEIRFWKRWLMTEGLHWPEDYAMRFDPSAPVQDYLARVIDRMPQDKVEILDVGAGPVTKIGKVHPSKQLAIRATDPLASDYAALLAKLGLIPPVATIYAAAEQLRDGLGDVEFDIVHAQNSLDHARDPIAGIEEMLAVTRPGGFVVLLHEENEGKNELYYALHKWDFSCEGGKFVIGGPGPHGPRRDIAQMLSGRAEIECSIEDEQVLVVMRKIGSRRGRKRGGSPVSAGARSRAR